MDELASEDGSDEDGGEGGPAEHATTQGRPIKHEVLDDDTVGPPPPKRRRVDGAPLVSPLVNPLTGRPRADYTQHPSHPPPSSSRNGGGGPSRSTRPPHYPYSSPYTVDARASAGAGSGRTQRAVHGPHPTASRPSTSNGYRAVLPRGLSSNSASGVRRDEGGMEVDEGEDEDAEGDVDAEGEIEDDEIQVLAHHPAPALAPREHYRSGGERSGGGGGCAYAASDRRGPPPSHHPLPHRYAPPPPPPPPHAFQHPVLGHGFADLDTPHGRRAFIANSIFYLFSTTYEPSDELPISSLLAYVNAAMPVDKYEEFDTGEVSRWVGAGAGGGGGGGGKEGRDGREGREGREGWRLEGDVVRIGRW